MTKAHLCILSAAGVSNLIKMCSSPDRDCCFLRPKFGFEDETFQGDEQKLCKGDDVATSWKVSERNQQMRLNIQ